MQFRHPISIRSWIIALAATVLLGTAPVAADTSLTYALSMHGGESFPEGPQGPFPWVNPDAPKGGALRLAVVGTFDSMNPYIILGVPARGLDLIYQSLLYRSWDEPFTLYPQIARAVEIAEDRSRIVFHLDPRARFQDGTPVTADDVLFTFNALLGDGRPHTRTYFSGVTGTHRIGDLAVAFDLETGNWELPMLLGLMPVLSRSHFETVPFAETSLEVPLGTGPYRVEEIDPGHRVVYRRDPDYWGADLPQNLGRYNFDTVEYTWYRDSPMSPTRRFCRATRIYAWKVTADGGPPDTTYRLSRMAGSSVPRWPTAALQVSVPSSGTRDGSRSMMSGFAMPWALPSTSTGSTRISSTASTSAPPACSTTPTSRRRGRHLRESANCSSPGEANSRPNSSSGPMRSRGAMCASACGRRQPCLEKPVSNLSTVNSFTQNPASHSPSSFCFNNPEDERIFLVWFANLERLGVRPVLRTVDAATPKTASRGSISIPWSGAGVFRCHRETNSGSTGKRGCR